jgi:hypothetical protein
MSLKGILGSVVFERESIHLAVLWKKRTAMVIQSLNSLCSVHPNVSSAHRHLSYSNVSLLNPGHFFLMSFLVDWRSGSSGRVLESTKKNKKKCRKQEMSFLASCFFFFFFGGGGTGV